MDPSTSSVADGSAEGSPRRCQRLFLPAPDPCSPPLASELARAAATSKPAAQHSDPPAATVVTATGTRAVLQLEGPAVAVPCSAPARAASQRAGCVSAANLSHALACAASGERTRPALLGAGVSSERLMPQTELAAARDAPADADDSEGPVAGVSAAETAAMVHLVSGLQSVASGKNVIMTLPKTASDEEGGSDAPRTPRKVRSSTGGPVV